MPFDKTTGTKFYYRLLDDCEHQGLLSSLVPGDLGCGIVVREEPTPENSNFQRFRYFSNSQSFLNFLREIQLTARSFHEFIPGHLPQKPHFDIDIEASKCLDNIENIAIQTLNSFVNALIETFAVLRVSISLDNDIAWYESNSDYLGNPRYDKRSYHVIVNGVAWANAADAKTFTEQVKQRMQFGSQYLDTGVAKYNSFLRMIGSHKVKGIGEFSGFKRRLTLEYNYPRFPLRDPYIGFGGDDGKIPLDHEAYPILELEESLVTKIRNERIIAGFPRPDKKYIFDVKITKRRRLIMF